MKYENMGIDSEAVLVYGWTFEYEEMKDIVEGIFAGLGYDKDKMDWERILFEDLVDWLGENHPDIEMGMASPYYNACHTESTFYITFRKDLIKDLIIHPEVVETYELLKSIGIYGQPEDLCALVHIY